MKQHINLGNNLFIEIYFAGEIQKVVINNNLEIEPEQVVGEGKLSIHLTTDTPLIIPVQEVQKTRSGGY